MTNHWLPVPAWEGLYEAHPDGKIRSLDRMIQRATWRQIHPGRVLLPSLNGNGYERVFLIEGERRDRVFVHHIIAATFIGPRPDGLVVCHNDGDRSNNAAANLRYDTATSNSRDTVLQGKHKLAERTHCANGHEYTPENTRYHRNRHGRVCRACAIAYQVRWYAQKASA